MRFRFQEHYGADNLHCCKSGIHASLDQIWGNALVWAMDGGNSIYNALVADRS